LHRRVDRAETGADRGALRAARRGLQDRRIWCSDKQPSLQDVRAVAIHSGFNMRAMQGHRATADVALLQLAAAPKGKTPAALGLPDIPINVGSRFTIAGIGVTVRGDGKSGGTIRVAGLVATGKPGTLQIRLVDPVGQGARDGLGACTGDSGAPVFEDKQGGPVIVGVVSWSTGPNGLAGCGGMTGVTPLTLYREWIVQTTQKWGAGL
jgi:Trypsin